MKILIYITAYYWDHYQGGSGNYISNKIIFDVPNFVEAKDMWSNIHVVVTEHLKKVRPFDQAVYIKEQREYTITKVEIL